MIDPITALAGITSAISMVKKAAKVANDLGSLAPMIGKMFDAKSTATKALMEAKKSKKGSNMGTALQIEMALEQARAFEEELKMLFMQTGKIDVWNKIKARQAEMDADDAPYAIVSNPFFPGDSLRAEYNFYNNCLQWMVDIS